MSNNINKFRQKIGIGKHGACNDNTSWQLTDVTPRDIHIICPNNLKR